MSKMTDYSNEKEEVEMEDLVDKVAEDVSGGVAGGVDNADLGRVRCDEGVAEGACLVVCGEGRDDENRIEEMLEIVESERNVAEKDANVVIAEVRSDRIGGARNGEESDGRRISIARVLRSKVGTSRETRYDREGSDVGAGPSSAVFLAPGVQAVQTEARSPRASHVCPPSNSRTPPKCCSADFDEEKEREEEERNQSLMSSLAFDDSDADWNKIGMTPAVEKLREVTRRPSMAYNLEFMTEEQCQRFFNPADFFYDMGSSSGSTTTTETDSSYRRGLERHHARKAARLNFIGMAKDEKRVICSMRPSRQLSKRKLEVCHRPGYSDVDFVRKPEKRRRLGEGEAKEDVWEREDRLARKRKVARRMYEGLEVDEKEPKAKQLNEFVPFDVEADRRIVEELNEDGEVLERNERVELVDAAVEMGAEEAVGAAGQRMVEAEAATEDSDDDDEEMPMDRSIGSDDDMSSASSTATAIPLRRSQRVRKPIDRWTYPVDHIPARRRVVRRNAAVQLARPVRRRPMMLPPPPPPAVVKQPRLPPVLARGLPQLPTPAAPTTLVVARKNVAFEEIDEELEMCRQESTSADYGNDGLDIAIRIARIANSVKNLKAKNAVPSPAQLTRLMNALAKVRSALGMN